jgi:hypothetical protein
MGNKQKLAIEPAGFEDTSARRRFNLPTVFEAVPVKRYYFYSTSGLNNRGIEDGLNNISLGLMITLAHLQSSPICGNNTG